MSTPSSATTAPHGDEWCALSNLRLPVQQASEWIVLPNCGATVTFTGTARDHAPGREAVERLEYEAYEEMVVSKLHELAAEMRDRWPDLGRIALLHRIGVVDLGHAAVVVATSSPHRSAAFEAARFGIDSLKSTVPIWKRETWRDGESWGLEPQHLVEVSNT